MMGTRAQLALVVLLVGIASSQATMTVLDKIRNAPYTTPKNGTIRQWVTPNEWMEPMESAELLCGERKEGEGFAVRGAAWNRWKCHVLAGPHSDVTLTLTHRRRGRLFSILLTPFGEN
jgi:hypothetical protein